MEFIKRIHANTNAAMSVEKILILGLIALPIIIILLVFRKVIINWFDDQRNQLQP